MEAEKIFTNNGVAVTFTEPERKKNKKRFTKEEIAQRRENAKERVAQNVWFDGGKFCIFQIKDENKDTFTPTVGLMCAGVMIKNRLHYVYMDKDRKLVAIPIETKYKISNEVPGSFSVVDYLLRYQKNELHDLIEDLISLNENWELVGKIGVRKSNPKPKGKNNNKSKKIDFKKKTNNKRG